MISEVVEEIIHGRSWFYSLKKGGFHVNSSCSHCLLNLFFLLTVQEPSEELVRLSVVDSHKQLKHFPTHMGKNQGVQTAYFFMSNLWPSGIII